MLIEITSAPVVADIEMHDFDCAPPSARGLPGGAQLRIVVVEVPVRVRARHIGGAFLPIGRTGIRSARRHVRRFFATRHLGQPSLFQIRLRGHHTRAQLGRRIA